jgi:hypothetical protein
MTTGKFKCPCCNKWKGYQKGNNQGILKIYTGKYTEISKQEIYKNLCLSCGNILINRMNESLRELKGGIK